MGRRGGKMSQREEGALRYGKPSKVECLQEATQCYRCQEATHTGPYRGHTPHSDQTCSHVVVLKVADWKLTETLA